jgi:hypothetical protein
MNAKIANAHAHIEGTVIARMILEFHREFRDTYGKDTLESSLCAVGPLQSLIGNAIDKGIIRITAMEQHDASK